MMKKEKKKTNYLLNNKLAKNSFLKGILRPQLEWRSGPYLLGSQPVPAASLLFLA
jgi:hypothetical protein